MPDTIIVTNGEKEAIYAYSDTTELDISAQAGVNITLFFKGGNRIIKIMDAGVEKTYKLKKPKKPDDTNSRMLRFSDRLIEIADDAIPYFPVLTHKEH